MKTKKEINLRRATIKDLDAVYKIDKIFGNHLIKTYKATRDLYDPTQFNKKLKSFLKKALKKRNEGYFILEKNNKVIAYSGFKIKKAEHWTRFKKEGYIAVLFVKKQYRSKGYGKLLMNHTMDYLKKRGCDLLTIGVHTNNHGAHKLYSKLNFKDQHIIMYNPVK